MRELSKHTVLTGLYWRSSMYCTIGTWCLYLEVVVVLRTGNNAVRKAPSLYKVMLDFVFLPILSMPHTGTCCMGTFKNSSVPYDIMNAFGFRNPLLLRYFSIHTVH